MKKLFLYTLFSISVLLLKAQITINSTDIPSLRKTITTSNAINTMEIDFQSTGENLLWNNI